MEGKTNTSIAFFIDNLGIGGAQKILLFLANRCAILGYNVSLIVLSNIKKTMNVHKDINIQYMGYDPVNQNNKGFFSKRLNQLLLIIRIRKKIREIRPDIICAFMPSLIKFALYSSKGMGIPIIGSERDNPYIRSKKLHRKINRVYKSCEVVVFQTERAMLAYDKDVQQKSVVIPNPSVPRVKKIEPYYGERRPVFISAGRLESVKQFDILIRAFKIVSEKYKDYKLYIYGDGTEKEKLENIINKDNLNGIVILKGKADDVFFKEYDCSGFILSSNSEGIPNVLIEAMSIGMPCISTDCEPGGPSLLLDGGRRGILVPVGDIQALANAICEYISNPGLAKNMGNLGLEINQEFAPDKITSSWIEVINSIPLQNIKS